MTSPGLEAAAEALSHQMGHFSWAWRRTAAGGFVYRDPAAVAQRERHMQAAAAVLRVGAVVPAAAAVLRVGAVVPAEPLTVPGYVVHVDEHELAPSVWFYRDPDDTHPQHVLSLRDLPTTRPGSPEPVDHTPLWDHIAAGCELADPGKDGHPRG